MGKYTRIVKRTLALFLVVLMSIESFCAVVGDNDGAAFITKAEFDSLKSDFQSQVDQYNSSIDNKINGAIASYLAGVTIAKVRELECPINNYSDIRWANGLYFKMNKRIFSSKNAYIDEGLAFRNVFWGKYRSIRANRQYWCFGNNYDVHYFPTMLIMYSNLNDPLDSKHFFNANYESGAGERAAFALTAFIKLAAVDGAYVFNNETSLIGLTNEQQMTDVGAGTYPRASMTYKGQNNWGIWSDGTNNTYFDVLEPAAGEYLRYDYKGGARYTGTGTAKSTSDYTYTNSPISLTAKNFVIASPMTAYGLDFVPVDSLKWDFANDLEVAQTWFESSNQRVADEEKFNFLMLGCDSSEEVNVAKIANSDLQLGTNHLTVYDWSGSEFKDLEFKHAEVYITQNSLSPVMGTSRFNNITGTSSSTSFKIKLPLFEKMYLNDLCNYKYKYLNKPLSLNQGIPLFDGEMNSGDLNIKLTLSYKTSDISSSESIPKRCRISMKRGDFKTNNDNQYYKTTTGAILKDYVMEGDVLDINIHVSKEDNSVWLRLGPENINPSGYYIKIDDIKMKLTEE